MDSATTLAIAADQGYEIYALSFRYGQRHSAELDAATNLARMFGAIEHKIVDLDLSSIGGSALTDMAIDVPVEPGEGIPVTYVPARNTIFLSIALGWAEVLESTDIFIGVNAVDYSGYPDCRPEFIQAYEAMANLATRAGVEGHQLTIHTPLIDLSKGDIILRGQDLGLDFRETISCYAADEQGHACGVCDACRLRRKGFEDAGVSDQTRYQ
jgi:7-cyano-7-deazaguanine synthase